MVTLEDVARAALALPGTSEGERDGRRTWLVEGRAFAWHRPYSKADVKRAGPAGLPAGEVVALAVTDLGEKEALLQAGAPGFFTIPHFDGYPAVLLALEEVAPPGLREALEDAWAAVAPDRLLEDRPAGPDGG